MKRVFMTVMVIVFVYLFGVLMGWTQWGLVPDANAQPLESGIDACDPYIQIECSDANCTMYAPRTGKTWHKWCKDNEKHCYWIPMQEWDGVGTPPAQNEDKQ